MRGNAHVRFFARLVLALSDSEDGQLDRMSELASGRCHGDFASLPVTRRVYQQKLLCQPNTYVDFRQLPSSGLYPLRYMVLEMR